MKTKDQMLFFKNGLPVILFILSFFQELSAQNMPLMKSISPSPYSSSTMVENALKIGLGMIGSEAPGAKFHIKSDYSIPIFLAEGYSGGQVNRSVKNLFYTNGKYFGIYQTSTDDTYNYFKNSLLIGINPSYNYLLSVDGSAMINGGLTVQGSASIYEGLYVGTGDNPIQNLPFIRSMLSLRFIVDPSPKSGSGAILTLNPDYAVVDGILKTPAFQMETGAGAGKVLTSDASGNASWSNQSPVTDDDWSFNLNGDLYSKPTVGKVGIGTLLPTQALEVCHENQNGGIAITQKNIRMRKSEIKFNVAKLEYPYVDEIWAIGNDLDQSHPNSFFIWNNNPDHPEWRKTAFFIAENGMTGINTDWPNATLDVNGSLKAHHIGIGIDAPAEIDETWRLFVEGGIKARQIKVTIEAFSDYVFDEDYKLMSLQELEQFIASNGHLPGIPSEDEVKKDGGLEVGDFQTKLLAKIEEQSLYIISLQKQIDELRSMISSIKNTK